MSGRYNERLDFGSPVPERVTFSTLYTDPHENQWRIDVTGNPRVVAPFVQGRGLELDAVPLSKEEDERWQAGEREEAIARLRDLLRGPVFVAAEGEESTPYLPPEMQLPELSLTIQLLKLAQDVPHRIHYEVDPDIYSGAQYASFLLYGSDLIPSVWCSASAGSVWLSLHGGGQAWVARVSWSAGAPAHYVLTGDVVRY